MSAATDNSTAETPLNRIVDRLSRVHRRWLYVAGAAFLVLLLLASSVHVRVALKSAAFFIEIFPDMPAYPQRWFTPEPQYSRISFPHAGEFVDAFIYHPTSGNCHSGLVLYIGVGDEYDDPHLDRVSRAFARNGVAVLIPVSDDLIDHRVTTEEHLVAVSAFEFVRELESVHPDRVGMFGVSVGGSIVANAAQERRINEQVRMVHSLGGYYDASELLASIALGMHRHNGEWFDWEPSEVTIRVVRNSILPVMPEEDYEALWNLFTERQEDIPEGLTDEGEALARLMVNRDPERVEELLSNLPEQLADYMQQISPATGIEHLRARAMILHDVHDNVLPYSESVRFYESLDASISSQLTLLEVFHHVRPDEDGGYLELVRDGFRLYRHVYLMHRSLDGRGWFVGVPDFLQRDSNSSSC